MQREGIPDLTKLEIDPALLDVIGRAVVDGDDDGRKHLVLRIRSVVAKKKKKKPLEKVSVWTYERGTAGWDHCGGWSQPEAIAFQVAAAIKLIQSGFPGEPLKPKSLDEVSLGGYEIRAKLAIPINKSRWMLIFHYDAKSEDLPQIKIGEYKKVTGGWDSVGYLTVADTTAYRIADAMLSLE